MQRLQKIMAAAGIASRRKSEELITAGRVTVNGQVVSELGAKADPESDHIRVDGKLLHGPERKLYVLLNKPKGYVTTVSDPEGRPTVMHLVRNLGVRLYPVGRLDYASEGLLLLTNDGALAQKLTRAASHVPKTYLVKISGKPPAEALQRLRDGVYLRGERPGERPVKTAPARILPVRDAENPWYEVTLTEGRNRQIRRMFEQVGHRVEKIKRVRYGPLELDVEAGEFRRLTPQEVEKLERWETAPARRRQIPPRPYASKPNVALKGDKGPDKRPRWNAVRAQKSQSPSRSSSPAMGARNDDRGTEFARRVILPADKRQPSSRPRTERADASPRDDKRVDKRPRWVAAQGSATPPSSRQRTDRTDMGLRVGRRVEKPARWDGAPGSTRPPSSRPRPQQGGSATRAKKPARFSPQSAQKKP